MSVTHANASDDRVQLQARRGPLHERLAPLASVWQSRNGYQACMRVHTDAHEHAAASNGPWLRCLTHQPRIGFKGRGSSDWLHGVGVSLPAAPNRWCHDASGAVVGRLGAQDFIIFDEGDGVTNLPHSLAERWQSAAPRGCYIVPRQHSLACIALDGVRAPELLARLCAVDLAPAGFAEDAIAQTQVALMSAVVLRLGDGAPSYRLFVDTSLALYCWDVLHEVAEDMGGGVRGALQGPHA
ncbi:MAG: hypothetical protein IT492_20825 [Gammaproteobacteria bacterium]|nr:hypothetical protein [Gammaproteobacteria bacterium]